MDRTKANKSIGAGTTAALIALFFFALSFYVAVLYIG